jgi:hypothetical protein
MFVAGDGDGVVAVARCIRTHGTRAMSEDLQGWGWGNRARVDRRWALGSGVIASELLEPTAGAGK